MDDLKQHIATSPFFDPLWYCRRYKDVIASGVSPIDHFLEFGMAWNRDPGPNFSSSAYLRANPDVAVAGINSFEHYLRSGQFENRRLGPIGTDKQDEVTRLRRLLETGGLVEYATEALIEIANQGPANLAIRAHEILAIWALGLGDISTAVDQFETISKVDKFPNHLRPLYAIALFANDASEKAHEILECDPSLDGLSAQLNGCNSDEDARKILNQIFVCAGLNPITFSETSPTRFDSLRQENETNLNESDSTPRVSVILAAYNAEATIETAVRSILNQTLQSLELILIDDCSTDNTLEKCQELALEDSRIHVIEASENQGAYACRNMGLDKARGDFVTLMDADDWAHPMRLEFQSSELVKNRAILGNMVGHLRVDNDLQVTRWNGEGALIHEAIASFMFRRDIMGKFFGYWDRTLVAADSELVRRFRHCFGQSSVRSHAKLPLLLQRDTDTVATRNKGRGMAWFYYGARREYHAAQTHHHMAADSLFYPITGNRPFPAPAIILQRSSPQFHLDMLFVGDFSTNTPATNHILNILREAPERSYGLVHIDSENGVGSYIDSQIRSLVASGALKLICFGETVSSSEICNFASQSKLNTCVNLPVMKLEEQQHSPGRFRN